MKSDHSSIKIIVWTQFLSTRFLRFFDFFSEAESDRCNIFYIIESITYAIYDTLHRRSTLKKRVSTRVILKGQKRKVFHVSSLFLVHSNFMFYKINYFCIFKISHRTLKMPKMNFHVLLFEKGLFWGENDYPEVTIGEIRDSRSD